MWCMKREKRDETDGMRKKREEKRIEREEIRELYQKYHTQNLRELLARTKEGTKNGMRWEWWSIG